VENKFKFKFNKIKDTYSTLFVILILSCHLGKNTHGVIYKRMLGVQRKCFKNIIYIYIYIYTFCPLHQVGAGSRTEIAIWDHYS